jgi:hypothetical protein
MNWRRLKYLLPSRRRKEERDVQEELESVAQLADPRELGNLTLAAENARETWGWTWLGGVVADARYAFRALGRQPDFVAVAVLLLALGIGANAAIFSFADAILLRPLPVVRPSEVLNVYSTTPDSGLEGMSYPDYRDLRERGRPFSGLVAYRPVSLAVATAPTIPPNMRRGTLVTYNFFRVLGIAPSLGRTFRPEEGTSSVNDRVAVLGNDF